MNETVMASAFMRADPVFSNEQRLLAKASEYVVKFGGSADMAANPFIAAVRSDRGLLSALLDDETALRLAMPLLELAARDLRGPEKTGDGEVHPAHDRHSIVRSPSPVEQLDAGGGAQKADERHELFSAPPASSNSEDGDEHLRIDRQETHLSLSSDPLPRGQHSRLMNASDNLAVPSGPSKPNQMAQHRGRVNARQGIAAPSGPKRGPAELRLIGENDPIFNKFLLRGDFPIGDLRWSAIPRFERDNKVEALVLAKLCELNPPADPNQYVRRHVKPEEMKAIIESAKKEAAADGNI
jgi:hypothetical protein